MKSKKPFKKTERAYGGFSDVMKVSEQLRDGREAFCLLSIPLVVFRRMFYKSSSNSR